MSDPQSDPSALKEWWSQIATAVGVLWAIFRVEYKTHQHHSLLFDEHGSPRIMIAKDCGESRKDCQSEFTQAVKDLSNTLSNETRRIHERIDGLPAQIIDTLSKAGAFKK